MASIQEVNIHTSDTTFHNFLSFTKARDMRVAGELSDSLKGKTIVRPIGREELLENYSETERIVALPETLVLTNPEAVHAGFLPPEFANCNTLLVPSTINEHEGLVVPVIGAFLGPEEAEAAAKGSIQIISPGTKAEVPFALKAVQPIAEDLLHGPEGPSSLDGYLAVDLAGADYAADALLAKYMQILLKDVRGSQGQGQYPVQTMEEYRKVMDDIEAFLGPSSANWKETGLVLQPFLVTHDQLGIGQQNFMGQLISWVGRIDHGHVRTNTGEEETIFTGASKIYVLGGYDELEAVLPDLEELHEDIRKARHHENALVRHLHSGAITRSNYQTLRGRFIPRNPANFKSVYTSGDTEGNLRTGGSWGIERRVSHAFGDNKYLKRDRDSMRDSKSVTTVEGIPVLIASTHQEYYATKEERALAPKLLRGSRELYDGRDPKYGHIRISTELHPEFVDLLSDPEALKQFLYPNITTEQKGITIVEFPISNIRHNYPKH